MAFKLNSILVASIVLATLPSTSHLSHLAFGQEPDSDWKCNAILSDAEKYTVPNIGAGQGVALINNKLYFYGDKFDATPRVGVIVEYTLDMKPTGRTLLLNQHDRPRLTHPTGIAYLDKNNVFIGDTISQKAKIYLLDWEKAWKDGNLDKAIKHVTIDDEMINGCRPLLVAANGRRYIATSDYGNKGNEIRLYDPEKLAVSEKTSDEGVMVFKCKCGPFNQNLYWDAEAGEILCVQNVTPGRGWRLQAIPLSIPDPSILGTKRSLVEKELDLTHSPSITLPPHTELEGYCQLPNGKSLFATAHRKDNVWIGHVKPTDGEPTTKKGHLLPY